MILFVYSMGLRYSHKMDSDTEDHASSSPYSGIESEPTSSSSPTHKSLHSIKELVLMKKPSLCFILYLQPNP